jgi:hypothetical protein
MSPLKNSSSIAKISPETTTANILILMNLPSQDHKFSRRLINEKREKSPNSREKERKRKRR